MSHAHPLEPTGRFFFRYRNALFPVVVISLCGLFAPAVPGLHTWLGGAAVALGLLLRAAVIGLAYIRRGGVGKKVYADDLVTEGMFATSRNPLYVGNLLIYIGVFIVHGNPWTVVLGSAFFLLAYRAIVAAEEHYLHEKFGSAYAAYCADVPRWWPRLSRLPAASEGMQFNWRRVIAKDYSTMSSAAFALLFVWARRVLVPVDGVKQSADLTSLGISATVVVLLLLVAWAAKKAGKLAH